jgi:hypothetical protein
MNMKKIQLFWLCAAFASALVGCNQTPAATEPTASETPATTGTTEEKTQPVTKTEATDENIAAKTEEKATEEKGAEAKTEEAKKTEGKEAKTEDNPQAAVVESKIDGNTPKKEVVLTPDKVTESKPKPKPSAMKDREAMKAANRKNADTTVTSGQFVGTWSKKIDKQAVENWPAAKAAYLKKFPGKKFYDRKAELIVKGDNTFTWIDEAGPLAFTSTGTWKLVKNEVTFTIKSVNGAAPKMDIHKKPFTAIMNKDGKTILRNAAEEYLKK